MDFSCNNKLGKAYVFKFKMVLIAYLETATVTRGVVGAPFQRQALPVTKAIAVFQPATATGKLNALIIPTTPSGFQFSIKACPGPT